MKRYRSDLTLDGVSFLEAVLRQEAEREDEVYAVADPEHLVVFLAAVVEELVRDRFDVDEILAGLARLRAAVLAEEAGG